MGWLGSLNNQNKKYLLFGAGTFLFPFRSFAQCVEIPADKAAKLARGRWKKKNKKMMTRCCCCCA